MAGSKGGQGMRLWHLTLHGLRARDGGGLTGEDPRVDGARLLRERAAVAKNVDAAVEAAAVVGHAKRVLDVGALAASATAVAEAPEEARVADLALVRASQAAGHADGHKARAAVG